MRYWLPDYENKLIGELQKQQNNAQFCDTLLQAEGISIPTHSSVLGALSLHLSQRLSASPAPPAGQKRRVQLHTLKPQTLIKLIGLLYSGELEVSDALEQRDVLAAAHLFGLPDLVEGEKVEVRNNQNGCKDCRRVETERRDAQIQVTPRSFRASVGTQTVTEESNWAMGNSQHLSFSSPFPQTCTNVGKKVSDNSTSTPRTAKAHSEEESVLERSTSTSVSLSCRSETATLQLSPSKDSICSRLQEGEAQRGQPETGEDSESSAAEEEDKQRQVQKIENRKAIIEKRQVCKTVATKSLEKMIEDTQISIKVKLRRRRTSEEMWEVVNQQDPEALAVVTSLRPDICKKPQEDMTAAVQSSPSTDQASLPKPCSPKPGPHASDTPPEPTSAPRGDRAPPLPPPRAVEETDEQIEKLLEDIMIGLNILPKMDKSDDESKDLDLSPGGGLSQVQKDEDLYYRCYEDYRDHNSNCSTETGDSDCTVHPPTGPRGYKSNVNTNNSSLSVGRSPRNSPQPTTSPCPVANQESNHRENPNVSELLPLSTETEKNVFSIADLQFLPCLSPLESYRSTCENQTATHSSLPHRPWLMDHPSSIQFSLATMAQKRHNSPVKPGTSNGCEEKVIRKVGENFNNNNKTCSNLELNKSGKDLKIKTEANINLSHCLVSLSCNNVLAKDGHLTSVSSSAPHTPMKYRLRPKTQSSGDVLRKKTIKKRELPLIHCTPETSSPNLQKRKRGRPRKKTKNPSLENSDGAQSEAKRPRLGEDLDEGPTKPIVPADDSVDVKPDDNNNTTPVEKKPRLVSKRQHINVQRTKDKSEKEQGENAGDVAMANSNHDSNHDSDASFMTQDHDEQFQSTSAQLLSHLANAKETPPQVANCASSESQFNCLSENSDQSEICILVVPEEVTMISKEVGEEQSTSPEQFHDGVTGSASQNEVATGYSVPLTATQEGKSLHTNQNPNVCESKDSEALDPKEMHTSGLQDFQDDEEDVEVLLHSPNQTSVTTEGLKPVEISPDEEEEEDSNEIDVTGSETDA